MSRFNSALAVALESDDVITPAVPVDEQVNFAEEQGVVDEAASDLKEQVGVVDELNYATESLEKVCTGLESAVADGGMDQQAARLQRIAMENILVNLPVDVNRFTVANESFADSRSRLSASQEALDGAREVLGKIIEAIRKAFRAMIDGIVGFFKRIGGFIKKLFTGADSLKAKAAAAPDTTNPEPMEVSGAAAEVLGDNPTKTMDEIRAAAVDVSGAMSRIAESFDKLGEAALKGDFEEFDRLMTSGDKATPSKTIDIGATSTIEFYPNGTSRLVKKPTQAPVKQKKIKALKRAEVTKLADQVKEVGSAIENLEKNQVKKVTTSAQKLMETMEKAVNEAASKGHAESGAVQKLKSELTKMRTLSSSVAAIGAQYTQLALRASSAAITVGHQSLAHNAAAKKE